MDGLQLQRPKHQLKFRDIHSIVTDPDICKTNDNRLAFLDEAGFSLATSVPFKTSTSEKKQKGIVIYYYNTKQHEQNITHISSVSNQIYLINSTETIGNAITCTA